MYEEASTEDLITIFTDTVVRYQQRPVYVHGINEGKKLLIYDLEDLKIKVGTLPVNDKGFDFTPVPLGFCNHNKDALFLQRTPKRQYKQGLCKTNLSVSYLTHDAVMDGAAKIIRTRSLAHCIEGRYPSLMNAIKLITDEGYRSVAFARKLAVDENLNLFFKQEKVGMVNEIDGKFILNRTKKYLERVLYA